MNSDWLNHPSMKNIHPAKKQILQELMKNSNNLTFDKMLPLLVSTNSKLKSQGLSFTKPENDLIIDLLTSNLSPNERKKFEAIRKMMPQ